MGPYGPWQVLPSGTVQSFIVTVSKGDDLRQDVLMQSSATQVKDWFEPTSSTTPATLPVSGDWSGTLSGPGIADYFWFAGQTNRTLSIAVTALDETGHASELKAQPVIGIWSAGDPEGSRAGPAPPARYPRPKPIRG